MLPIGFGPVAPQQTLAVPAPNAPTELHKAFGESLSALGKHDRYVFLHTELVDAARSGDHQKASYLLAMLDVQDNAVLGEALSAAVRSGHLNIVESIVNSHGWMLRDRFSEMNYVIENHDLNSPASRKMFECLFDGCELDVAASLSFDDNSYEARVQELIVKVKQKVPDLAIWCAQKLKADIPF